MLQRPEKIFCCRAILRTLVDIIGNTQEVQNAIRAQHVIVSIFRRAEMKPCWINYIELLLLKIINNYKETKEVKLMNILIIYIHNVSNYFNFNYLSLLLYLFINYLYIERVREREREII